jgi:hypothetical protein
MSRASPLCPTCGAWDARCGHPPDPRLQWTAAPLGRAVLDLLGTAVFTLLIAAVLIGLGPLLWWLAYGWPPRDWIEWFGVIMVALVSVPGTVVGLGMIVSIPEHWPGRRWTARDLAATDADRWTGDLVVRRGRPEWGELARNTTAPLPAPDSFDMSTETAAKSTADPAKLITAALAALLARGHVELSAVHRTGWTYHGDAPPCALDHLRYYLRPRGPDPVHLPWLEQALLTLVTRQPDTDLLTHVAMMTHGVADALGFEYDEDGHEPYWPDEATQTPGEVLQQRLLEDLADADPPAPDVAAALAAWRARHPALPDLLDGIADIARALLDVRAPPNHTCESA